MSYPILRGSVLALDCATTCGYAWGNAGLIRAAGVQAFPLPRGASPGLRWVLFREWLAARLDEWKPEVVTYEQPFIAGMRSGTVAEIAYGMCTRVQELCTQRGIEYRPVANSLIKQHATGAGNAKKEWVIAAAGKRWPEYDAKRDPGGDEADARFLLSFAQHGFPDLAAEKAKAKEAERRVAAEAKAAEKAKADAATQDAILAQLDTYGDMSVARLKERLCYLGAAVIKRHLLAMETSGKVFKTKAGWARQ